MCETSFRTLLNGVNVDSVGKRGCKRYQRINCTPRTLFKSRVATKMKEIGQILPQKHFKSLNSIGRRNNYCARISGGNLPISPG